MKARKINNSFKIRMNILLWDIFKPFNLNEYAKTPTWYSFINFSFRAACRETNKEGVCPKLARDNQYASCAEDCQTDAECSGTQVTFKV